jgi:hypothetical protein
MITSSFIVLSLLAQAASPSESPEAKALAQSLLSEGTKLFNAGEFAPALEKFTAAYAAFASPKLLYNIAQTNRALGRPADAMNAFERFLLQAPDALAEMTTEVHTSMSELQAKLGRIHIECPTARTEISLDGKVVGLSPLRDLVWAEPGKHQVTARHPDMIPVVQDVEVASESVRNVVLLLQRLDGVPVPVVSAPKAQHQPEAGMTGAQPPNSSNEAQAQPESVSVTDSARTGGMSEGWWLGRKWTWVAAGSTVALVAAASIVGASMQSRFDSLNQSCGSASTDYTTGPGCSESEISSVIDRRNTANVLWALSGAAAVTTGILFFVEGRRVTVAPMAAASPGLTARVTY